MFLPVLKKLRLFLLLLSVFTSCFNGIAFAKGGKSNNVKKQASGTIVKIPTKAEQSDYCKITSFSITGLERVSQNTIIKRANLSIDQLASTEYLNNLTKQIYALGDFDDVSVNLTNNCVVQVAIKEKQLINKIEFVGNKKLPSSALMSELKTKEKKPLSKADLFFDQQRIKFIYFKSGFLDSSLDIYAKELKNNKTDIFFDIKEGESSMIKNITFVGNEAFSKKELIQNTSLREGKGLGAWSSKSGYDEQKIQLMEEELRSLYLQNGFIDFNIKSISSSFNDVKNTFDVNILINEGPKYKIGGVEIESEIEKFANLETSDPEIKKLIAKLQKTKFYNESDVFVLKQAIEYKLSSSGYATTIVEKRLNPNPATKLVKILFNIKQTNKLYINKITITGNSKTNDNVIRREILVHEGDIYNVAMIRDSIQNIKYLGFVRNVELNESINTDGKNLVDLEFKVEEGPTGSINLSAGYNNFDKLMGSISYNQQNIAGRGYNGSLVFEQSRYRRNIMLSLTNPRVFDTRLLLGGSVAKVKSDNQMIQTFSQDSNAFSVDFGYSLGKKLRQIWTYAYRDDRMAMLSGNAMTPAMQEQIGNFKTSIITQSLVFDKRNNQMLPTKGFMIRYNQSYAGLGGNINYLSYELMSSFHQEVFTPSFVFSIIAKTGHIHGFGGKNVNIKDRFFFGMTEMRGFDFNGIGPRQAIVDSNGKVIKYADPFSLRGNNYNYISFEQTFPNFIPKDMGFKTYIFYDLGNVYGVDTKLTNPNYKILDTSSFRTSYGIGLVWQSPMGPIGFDYGVTQRTQAFDNKRNFRLNVGINRFMM